MLILLYIDINTRCNFTHSQSFYTHSPSTHLPLIFIHSHFTLNQPQTHYHATIHPPSLNRPRAEEVQKKKNMSENVQQALQAISTLVQWYRNGTSYNRLVWYAYTMTKDKETSVALMREVCTTLKIYFSRTYTVDLLDLLCEIKDLDPHPRGYP